MGGGGGGEGGVALGSTPSLTACDCCVHSWCSASLAEYFSLYTSAAAFPLAGLSSPLLPLFFLIRETAERRQRRRRPGSRARRVQLSWPACLQVFLKSYKTI